MRLALWLLLACFAGAGYAQFAIPLIADAQSRYAKPSFGVKLNRQHAMAHGLQAAYVINENGGPVINLVKGVPDKLVQPARGMSRYGQTIGVTNASEYANVISSIPDNSDSSFFIIVKPNVTTIDRGLITIKDGASLEYFWWLDTVGGELRLGAYAGSATYGSTRMTTPEYWKMSGSAYWNGSRYIADHGFVNGVEEITNVDIGTYIGTGPVDFFTNGSNKIMVGDVALFYFWNRAITREEHLSLHADPYQLLESPSVIVATPVTAPPVTAVLLHMEGRI